MVFIEWLGLWSNATILAEYDVNIARVVRNVVRIMKRPDVVGMNRWVPCWQTAPPTNVSMSNSDSRSRSTGCHSCVTMIITTNTRAMKQHRQTLTSNGNRNIFDTADNGGWRKMIGVLCEWNWKMKIRTMEKLHNLLLNNEYLGSELDVFEPIFAHYCRMR